MSDEVNCAVQSTVTPSIWAQQGASQHSKSSKAWQKYYSSASTSNLGTRMTPTRANILQCMMMEEPSDSWILTTEQHTTAAGSRCSAEVSAGKMGTRAPLQHSGMSTLVATILHVNSIPNVCLWFSATLCSQDAMSGDTSPLYRVTITVPIRPIMN